MDGCWVKGKVVFVVERRQLEAKTRARARRRRLRLLFSLRSKVCARCALQFPETLCHTRSRLRLAGPTSAKKTLVVLVPRSTSLADLGCSRSIPLLLSPPHPAFSMEPSLGSQQQEQQQQAAGGSAEAAATEAAASRDEERKNSGQGTSPSKPEPRQQQAAGEQEQDEEEEPNFINKGEGPAVRGCKGRTEETR